MDDQGSDRRRGEPPPDLIQLYLGLLKKGPTWTAVSSLELESNQQQHLLGLQRLREAGNLLLAGPTPDGSDLRGILILRADSMEEAEFLMQGDPHLQTNRLTLELHPLYLSASVLAQPLIPEA
ncbi:MAG: YciI family protein [Anaerolineales bacterium]